MIILVEKFWCFGQKVKKSSKKTLIGSIAINRYDQWRCYILLEDAVGSKTKRR